MSDLFQKITESKNWIEKIGSIIPGFKGYMEKTSRRDADKLLRETIATRVEQQWSRLSELQKQLISAGDIDQVDDLETAAIKLRTLTDRIRTAAYGYAGFFDAVKVKETELGKLYEFDAGMAERTVQISSAIDNVASSMGSDGFPAAVRNVAAIAQESLDLFNRRSEVILGSNTEISQ